MIYHKIKYFIKLIRESFPDSVKVYSQGSCVQFALILKSVFPDGEVMWNEDHAVFRYDTHYFDITGDINGDNYNAKLMDYDILKVKEILELRFKTQ